MTGTARGIRTVTRVVRLEAMPGAVVMVGVGAAMVEAAGAEVEIEY
jgi:hypothetical protein